MKVNYNLGDHGSFKKSLSKNFKAFYNPYFCVICRKTSIEGELKLNKNCCVERLHHLHMKCIEKQIISLCEGSKSFQDLKCPICLCKIDSELAFDASLNGMIFLYNEMRCDICNKNSTNLIINSKSEKVTKNADNSREKAINAITKLCKHKYEKACLIKYLETKSVGIKCPIIDCESPISESILQLLNIFYI